MIIGTLFLRLFSKVLPGVLAGNVELLVFVLLSINNILKIVLNIQVII